MAHSKASPNVVETIRIVAALGGTVTGIHAGGKHIKMYAVTPQGNRLTLILSKAKVEPHKLKGWTRQEFNKADARADNNRRSSDEYHDDR